MIMTLAHRYKILVNACWLFAVVNAVVACFVLYRVTHKYTYSINVHPPQQIVITNYTSSASSSLALSSNASIVDKNTVAPLVRREPLNYGYCLFDGVSAISYNGRIYHTGDYLLGHLILTISRTVIVCDDIIFYFDNTIIERKSENGDFGI